jgi:signal transduction histidine kinase
MAARVKLDGSPTTISLQIIDCGTGFDPQSLDSKQGLGFVSMRERLRLVGGEIKIDAVPSRGTQIHVRVPHSPPIQSELLDADATAPSNDVDRSLFPGAQTP